MPYREEQPTLIDYFGTVPVTRLAKKRLFGGLYLHFYDYCSILALVYESGAILGRALRDKLDILEEVIGMPWWGPEPIESSQERMKNRLDTFRNEAGREPHSFLEFILIKELENAIEDKVLKQELRGLTVRMYDTLFQKSGVGGQEIGSLEKVGGLFAGSKKIVRALGKKVPLPYAEFIIRMFGREGIGFGVSFPELTERMYRNLHENIDMHQWPQARAHTLALFPESPPTMSLEEGEKNTLQVVAAYASKYYPELLDPLDLKGYIDTEGNR